MISPNADRFLLTEVRMVSALRLFLFPMTFSAPFLVVMLAAAFILVTIVDKPVGLVGAILCSDLC